MLPSLLYERLDAFGIDFAVLYPTSGLGAVRVADDDRARSSDDSPRLDRNTSW